MNPLLRLDVEEMSLTLQLVLGGPVLQQGEVADDVLQEDHLGGGQHRGALLGRGAAAERQTLLRALPLWRGRGGGWMDGSRCINYLMKFDVLDTFK